MMNVRQMKRRTGKELGRLLTALLLLATAPAQAGPAEEDATPAEDSPMREAKDLHAKGTAQYDMSNYDAAIESWTKAYELVVRADGDPTTRAALVYNVSRAQRKAYDIDRDITRLRKALALLEKATEFGGLGEDAESDNVTKLDEEIVTVRERIAEHEANEAPASATSASSTTSPPMTPSTTRNPVARDEAPRGRKLTLAGIGAMAVGVGGAGLAVGGAVMGSSASKKLDDYPDDVEARRDVAASGNTGNTLLVVGAVVAGVGVLSGAVLIGLGAKAKRKTALSPALAPGFAGLEFRGRF